MRTRIRTGMRSVRYSYRRNAEARLHNSSAAFANKSRDSCRSASGNIAANDCRIHSEFYSVPQLKFSGREGHAYDVRKGKYLGFGSSFKLTLVPGEGSLIALLPYHVERLQVDSSSTAKPGDCVQIQVAVKASSTPVGQHVLLMTVQQPDGKNSLEYRKIRNSSTGQLSFNIPFALNDQKGKWLLQIKDGASGSLTQKTIELK